MPVNPARTMLLIAAWPDNLVAPELIVWGIGRRLRRIQWYSRRVTECAYNAAVKELALPSDCDHFIVPRVARQPVMPLACHGLLVNP